MSASTQNQALAALLFLYREVLGQQLAWLQGIVRAKRPLRLPVVLSRQEVAALFRHIRGTPRLMSALMYGSDLRLLERARLRVKDLDFTHREITVRDGKGRKDRVTVLLVKLVKHLHDHLSLVRDQHGWDLSPGAGYVELPDALSRKYPSVAREWGWQ